MPATVPEADLLSTKGQGSAFPDNSNIDRLRLFDETDWLFEKKDKNKLEFIQFSQSLNRPVSPTVISGVTSSINIPDLAKHEGELFIIIRQYNTWSRLSITATAFETIFDLLKPHSYFVDFIRTFGYREDDHCREVSGYRWRRGGASTADEFCYIARFFQQNGRAQGRPWSLRHTGIYQKTEPGTSTSTWMLIQPSPQIEELLELAQKDISKKERHPDTHSLYLHGSILFTASRTWLDYIDYIQSTCEELQNKAYHSKVGIESKVDFSVSFSDCQRLERYRQDIITAKGVLGSNISIVRGCQNRCRHVAVLSNISLELTPLRELEALEEELVGYERTLEAILQRSEGALRLLGKILDFRHDETMRIQTQLLTQLSREQASSNDQIAQVLKQSAKDSRLLKALTIMTTLYLPTSIVLAFFGSNLVQTRETDTPGKALSIVLVQEAWLAIAIPAPLTIATIGLIFWMGGLPHFKAKRLWS
ncbi:hypothetical protein F4815DRAFT_206276 [Daldinia loculata]|nr:hypothetical protein F4815DRAFT_206276 [Daldinia loculata]